MSRPLSIEGVMGGDGVSDNSTKNYELNISRSLAKKLRATKRVECLEFTLTSGGDCDRSGCGDV